MNKLILSILLISLTSCATYNVRVTDKQLEKVKKVGVVSVVGNDILYSYLGMTAFNNENKLYDFPELDIDSYIIQEMKSELSSANNKVEILPISVKRTTVTQSYKHPDYLSGFDLKAFIKNISKISTSNNLSHILVVSRDDIQFDDVPVQINGLGLRKRGNKIGAFIFIKFQLIDMGTKKEISNSFILKRKKDTNFPWVQPFEKNTNSTKNNLISYFKESISDKSMGIARMLISSPKEMKTCSERVFSKGFEIDGKIYYKLKEVKKIINDFRYKKIVREKVAREDADPSFIGRFNQFDKNISACLRSI